LGVFIFADPVEEIDGLLSLRFSFAKGEVLHAIKDALDWR
jgi:hypothetical protein